MHSSSPLTIFYDGNCPLCLTEMQHLKSHDVNNRIHLIDIHQADFDKKYPEITFDKAMKILHATYQGQTLLGLEVTHRAWTIAGRGLWVAPLNWPIIKSIAHLFYLFFAKYRHSISRFIAPRLGISSKCQKGTCYGNTTSNNHRRQ